MKICGVEEFLSVRAKYCSLNHELLVRRVGSAADVKVTEVAQGGAIFLAHAAGKVWVLEVAVPGGLRHVLEHAQTLLDCFLALWRHVAPGRQNFILDMVALMRRHLLPDAIPVAHVLLLLRRQLPEALLILHHPLAFLGAQPLAAVSSIVIFRASGVLARRRTIGIVRFAIESRTV
jgi:hypothetical protein